MGDVDDVLCGEEDDVDALEDVRARLRDAGYTAYYDNSAKMFPCAYTFVNNLLDECGERMLQSVCIETYEDVCRFFTTLESLRFTLWYKHWFIKNGPRFEPFPFMPPLHSLAQIKGQYPFTPIKRRRI